MADITVPVPDARTAEFYQFFGLWLAGSLSISGGTSGAFGDTAGAPEAQPQIVQWSDSTEDFEDGCTLWEKYSPNARAMFSLLIDNPGKEFTGDEVAEACNIAHGAHGVAGVLAWPGRHGAAIGRGLPMRWREDPETLKGYYWMTPEGAEFFKGVRDSVEKDAG